jgi:hypothetical protein
MIGIKEMRMPENCMECLNDELCLALADYDAKCPFTERILTPIEFDAYAGRHPECPMVEIKEEAE